MTPPLNQTPQQTAINPHRQLGRGMALIASVLVLGLLTLFFNSNLDQRNNPNRQLQVAPGAELVLKRSSNGHYIFLGTINGQPVTFLLDTGATFVSIPAYLGERLGLEAGAREQAITANGVVETRATRINELAFGPFKLHDLPANLNPGMRDDFILLGMSVLRHIEFTQRGDTMTLRPLAPAQS
jgi:aspartyl protease family protein